MQYEMRKKNNIKNVAATVRYSLIGKTLVFKINVVGSSPTTSALIA
jgi:hypothetical protein